MRIGTKLIAGMIALSGVSSAKAQEVVKAFPQSKVAEKVAGDTVKVKSKFTKDVSLRTFHYPITGNNFTALGMGVGKNYKKNIRICKFFSRL